MVYLFTLIALIAWPLVGATGALGLYCVLLLFNVFYHRRHVRRLAEWAAEPVHREVPEARGIWGDAYSMLARQMRHRRKSETSLTAALERFRMAGAAMPEGVSILDEEHRLVWCNPMAEQHFGVSLARDLGQQITYIVRSPQFRDYLGAGRSDADPLRMRQALGIDRHRVLSVQIVPFGDKDLLVISRDITRFEAIETMRRDFVANVSHELRTPLTVIIGFLETVLDAGAVPVPTRRPLGLALDQATRMQRLVEDLLTLSRLEGSHNPLREEDVDVCGLLRVLHQDAIALSAGRHRILLSLETAAGVRGSADELRSAFGNLVTNAVRYTPTDGEIRLIWQEAGDHLVFAVQDTGFGIEAEHIPRLTERFYRVDRSRSRETGGTGLGLAIVKHVLTRHDGRLDITSEPGKGSRFAALLPLRRAVAAQAAPSQGQAA